MGLFQHLHPPQKRLERPDDDIHLSIGWLRMNRQAAHGFAYRSAFGKSPNLSPGCLATPCKLKSAITIRLPICGPIASKAAPIPGRPAQHSSSQSNTVTLGCVRTKQYLIAENEAIAIRIRRLRQIVLQRGNRRQSGCRRKTCKIPDAGLRMMESRNNPTTNVRDDFFARQERLAP